MLQCFQFVERARPVGTEKARQAAVSEDFSSGLATGAVVGLVVGLADVLDLFAASRTQLAVTAVNGHLFAESRDLFGEAAVSFGVQAVDPELKKHFAGGWVEFLPLFPLELVGLRDGR